MWTDLIEFKDRRKKEDYIVVGTTSVKKPTLNKVNNNEDWMDGGNKVEFENCWQPPTSAPRVVEHFRARMGLTSLFRTFRTQSSISYRDVNGLRRLRWTNKKKKEINSWV